MLVSDFVLHCRHLFYFSVLVLEARIQQLQSGIVLDVKQAKVEFLKAPSPGRGVLYGRGPKGTTQEKADAPKSRQTLGKDNSKSQPSRWMEKLTQEKKSKLKKQQHLQQKIQKNVKEKPAAKYTGSKSNSILPGTTHKTISPTAKKTVPLIKKGRGRMKLSDEIRAAVSPTATPTSGAAAAGTAVVSHKVSKGKRKESKKQVAGESQPISDAQGRATELAEVEELEKRLSQQVSQLSCSSNPERLQEDSEGTACRDIRLSICSYLEACVFAGNIERAHSFLLSQHRVMSRRKHLNTSVYNIMMRVWAKKVSWTVSQFTRFENRTYVGLIGVGQNT